MRPSAALHRHLDALVARYEQPSFIPPDPISVPHAFDDPRDQEVIGLYAALLAWGQRRTVLAKMAELCERMRYRPYQFVRAFDEARDGARLSGFKHRTFQPEDACWLTRCLGVALRTFGTLEDCFARHLPPEAPHVGPALEGFSTMLPSLLPDVPLRLRKHLARPSTGSACKRLNLYLRWMVRPGPVDLGCWMRLRPSQLVLPLDVHVGRQARVLGLLTRPTDDWAAALELTATCRHLCPEDPVRYDFALFGAGVCPQPAPMPVGVYDGPTASPRVW
jgi:uncharacterized protein (TIGR02757 family)